MKKPSAVWLLTPFVVTAAICMSGVFDPFSHILSDLRFRMSSRPPTGQVAIVAIDQPSIAELGTWPFSRAIYARAIDALIRAGVRDIAVDIDLSSASAGPGDQALEEALKRAGGGVALAAYRQSTVSARGSDLVSPLDRFAQNAWTACVDVQPDSDGRVRAFPTGFMSAQTSCPSMPIVLAGADTHAETSVLIDFSIDASAIEHLSIADLIAGRVPSERIS